MQYRLFKQDGSSPIGKSIKLTLHLSSLCTGSFAKGATDEWILLSELARLIAKVFEKTLPEQGILVFAPT
jgi:hypothetical protein